MKSSSTSLPIVERVGALHTPVTNSHREWNILYPVRCIVWVESPFTRRAFTALGHDVRSNEPKQVGRLSGGESVDGWFSFQVTYMLLCRTFAYPIILERVMYGEQYLFLPTSLPFSPPRCSRIRSITLNIFPVSIQHRVVLYFFSISSFIESVL